MDTNKLKIFMMEKNYTQKKLSEELGISIQSFNAKVNKHRQFKLHEVIKIIDILDIKNPVDIFL